MVEFLALQYRMGKVTQSQLMQAVKKKIISAEQFGEIIGKGRKQ